MKTNFNKKVIRNNIFRYVVDVVRNFFLYWLVTLFFDNNNCMRIKKKLRTIQTQNEWHKVNILKKNIEFHHVFFYVYKNNLTSFDMGFALWDLTWGAQVHGDVFGASRKFQLRPLLVAILSKLYIFSNRRGQNWHNFSPDHENATIFLQEIYIN